MRSLILLCGCGYLTVYLETVPTNDPGRFNVEIDGVTRAAGLGNGSIRQVKLSTGSHTVSQTAAGNTQPADYKSVISGDCDAAGRVFMSFGDDKSCTITNTNLRWLPTTGAQRTAIILASAPDSPQHPFADKAATASVFYDSNNPKSARSFFREASYGALKIAGASPSADGTAADIYGPYQMSNAACDFPLALADPDIDFSKYDRLIVLMNNSKCCCGGVSDTVPRLINTGEGPRYMTLSTIYNDVFGEAAVGGKIGSTTLHEYGHQLGMSHAGAWFCPSAPVAANGCWGNGYLEPIDLVSQGTIYAHPNPVHKERMGWLDGGRATVATSGSYTLHVYEDAANNLKVLKIPRRLPGGWFYLAYRHASPPFDDWVSLTPQLAQGVTVHIDEWGGGFDTGFLDATPGSISGKGDIKDAALLVNQTLTDPLSGVSITVLDVTSTTATVSVTSTMRAQRWVQLTREANTIADVVMDDVGTVSGGGLYNVGQSVALSATPKAGWSFWGWLEYSSPKAAKLISKANPYNLTVADDQVLTALFSPAPPPNDNFSAAAAATIPAQFKLFTAGATREAGEKLPGDLCGPGFLGGATIWYRYTPQANQTITIDTTGSFNSTGIAVYTGNQLNALALVGGACSLYAAQTHPKVTFSAVAGTTYSIQIDSVGGDTTVNFQ
jgi:hypothetical protein